MVYLPAMQPAARPVDRALIDATVEALRRHVPFDRMGHEDLLWMVSRLALVYFAPRAVVLAPDAGVPQHFFIVRQGSIAGLDPNDVTPRWRLTAGEVFPLGALLAKRPVTSLFRAQADTFCWRLPAADFETLLSRSPPFHEACTRRVASLLETSRRQLQTEYAASAARDPLSQPLAALLRPPVVCAEDETLAAALTRMRDARVGSVVVIRDDGTAAGIFTLRDLRDRVATENVGRERPVREVMTRNPVTLPAEALALEAALLMARHAFHHIVITRAGKVVGVVSESDLFALRRLGMTGVSEAIRAAGSLAGLVHAAADVRTLAESLVAQGVAAEQLTRIVSTLNDLVTARLIELECSAAGLGAGELCWMAFGSEGRHEQTLATDQDNGILFPDPPDGDGEAQRARLLPLARRINDGLAACGFPLCKGGVMASNPRWCLSLAEWKSTFADWMDKPDGEALLNATIFFDLRGLWGCSELADTLRAWLARNVPDRSLFLRLMAENALRNAPPLGVLRDFAVERHADAEDSLDLKLNGVAPFVDAARILSLAAGDQHTGTVERLRALVSARRLHAAEVEAWVDAFHFIQMLRLRHQQQQAASGHAPDNFLQPDRLNDLERRILKEAFRQSRKLQERLRLDFRL
jgi:CBS domain-containing protein